MFHKCRIPCLIVEEKENNPKHCYSGESRLKKKGITDQRTWSGFSEVNDPLGKPSRLVNSEKFCKLPTIIRPFEYNCWHFFAQFLTGLYN